MEREVKGRSSYSVIDKVTTVPSKDKGDYQQPENEALMSGYRQQVLARHLIPRQRRSGLWTVLHCLGNKNEYNLPSFRASTAVLASRQS
jgi:hypothetical protein